MKTSGIWTRAEKRAMERAKEKHVRKIMEGGYDAWRDITDSPQTQHLMANSEMKWRPEKVYLNGMFLVQVYPYPCAWGHDVKRVMIRWVDARPEHDWSLFQRLKNDLFGPERVCLEVYPAETNKQDEANCYWLWLMPENFDCPIEVKRPLHAGRNDLMEKK